MLEMAVARHESVTWEWVKGHAGDSLNERVDRIASGEAVQCVSAQPFKFLHPESPQRNTQKC